MLSVVGMLVGGVVGVMPALLLLLARTVYSLKEYDVTDVMMADGQVEHSDMQLATSFEVRGVTHDRVLSLGPGNQVVTIPHPLTVGKDTTSSGTGV